MTVVWILGDLALAGAGFAAGYAFARMREAKRGAEEAEAIVAELVRRFDERRKAAKWN